MTENLPKFTDKICNLTDVRILYYTAVFLEKHQKIYFGNGGSPSLVVYFESDNKSKVIDLPSNHNLSVYALEKTHDQKYVLVSGTSEVINIIDASKDKVFRSIKIGQRSIYGIQIKKDNLNFFFVDGSGFLKTCNIENQNIKSLPVKLRSSEKLCLSLNNKNSHIYGSGSKSCVGYNLTKNYKADVFGYPSGLRCSRVSKNQRFIFSGGLDGNVYVSDLLYHRYVNQFKMHFGCITGVRSCGNLMLSCSYNGKLAVFSTSYPLSLLSKIDMNRNVYNLVVDKDFRRYIAEGDTKNSFLLRETGSIHKLGEEFLKKQKEKKKNSLI